MNTEERKAYMRNYRASARGKAIIAKQRKSAKAIAYLAAGKHKIASKKFRALGKAKPLDERYRNSIKGIKSRMLKDAKRRAKQKGIKFDLTPQDLSIPQFCPLLGIAIKRGNGKTARSSPTIDRKDNSKGYIRGNVAVVSHAANTLKSDFSVEEMKSLAVRILIYFAS